MSILPVGGSIPQRLKSELPVVAAADGGGGAAAVVGAIVVGWGAVVFYWILYCMQYVAFQRGV